DRCDGSSGSRPFRPHAGRVIEQCSWHKRRVQVLVGSVRHGHRLLPGRSVLRGQRAELGPREVRNKTPTDRIPPRLVDHIADRVREVLRSRPVHGDFGNRVLTFEWFAASFEVDILCEALQIISASTRTCSLPLYDLNTGRLDARSVQVRKTGDAYHTQDH